MEKILSNDNSNQVYRKVKSNREVSGVDGMNVGEHLSFIKDAGKQLLTSKISRKVGISKETKGDIVSSFV